MSAATLERPAKAKARREALAAVPAKKPARDFENNIVEPAIFKMTKEALEAAHNYVYAARGVLNMMIVVYGGDIKKEQRLADDELFGLVAFMAGCLNHAKDLTCQVNSEVATACFNAVAILDTLENIISNFELENPFGDETMDAIFGAIQIALNDLDAALEAHSADTYRAGA